MAQVVGGFTEKSAKRIGDAVRWVESQPVDLAGQSNRLRGDRQIWAKITGGDADGYSWTEQRRTATGFEDVPDGRSGTTTTNKAIGTDDENDIEADTIVRLVLNLSDDAEPYWTILSTGGGGGVDLKNNGTTAVTAAGSINIPSASADVLAFGGSGDAGTLSITPADATWKVLTWNGSKWIADYVRAHA